MKLDDKIRNRKIAYLLERESSTAFELALFYYVLAKRKNDPRKIFEACLKSIYWLEKAEVDVPENIRKRNPLIQLEEIENLLVLKRSRFNGRDRMAVGARMSTEVPML